MSSVSLGCVQDKLAPVFSLAKESLSGLQRLIIELIKSNVTRRLRGKPKLAGFALLAIVAHVYYRHKYSFWSRRNVKTPMPIPVFGNFLSFFFHSRQRLELEWPQKYGKIYGLYTGTKPSLVVADANILRRICIKDFNKFPNRHFPGIRNKYQRHFLFLQEDDHWRGMRALMMPTFSSGKIRAMFKIFDRCTDELVEQHWDKVDNEGGSAVIDLPEVLGAFIMGSALSCFYGVHLKADGDSAAASGVKPSNTREEFAANASETFRVSVPRFLANVLIPGRVLSWFDFTTFDEKPYVFFDKKVQQIIAHRQREELANPDEQYNDYLQLLLDAKLDDEEADSFETDQHEQHHAMLKEDRASRAPSSENLNTSAESPEPAPEWRPSRMRLTEMEVSCQTMMLMMVATETTTNLLAATLFLLSHHPEIQEALHKELVQVQSESGGKFDYEHITSCVYLDCVVSESLRLNGPALAVDRVAAEDYFIPEYNILVPKGTPVWVAIYAVHRNPDYWEQPDTFDPDRFRPENAHKIVPGSYCPFGMGPRTCIGFRFALTETKITLAKLLTEFKLEAAPGTRYPPEPKVPSLGMNALKDLFVTVRRRS